MRKETNRKLKTNQTIQDELKIHFFFLKNQRNSKGSNGYYSYLKFK